MEVYRASTSFSFWGQCGAIWFQFDIWREYYREVKFACVSVKHGILLLIYYPHRVPPKEGEMSHNRSKKNTLKSLFLAIVFLLATASECNGPKIGDGDVRTLHKLCEQFNSCPSD